MMMKQKKNSIAKYINICFQMASIIAIFFFIGKVVMNKFGNHKFILGIFVFIGVLASIYHVVKDFIKK